MNDDVTGNIQGAADSVTGNEPNPAGQTVSQAAAQVETTSQATAQVDIAPVETVRVHAELAVQKLNALGFVSRELSLAKTKIEEALHWIEQHMAGLPL